ncbi:spermidine/putrescine ABC transporter substrate-binding protein [Streptomyces rectiverticillatus]|uniref:polyamine ABC transporter substrate-binding protein n=1 Tax=Streptomyces rectiverticillatus TaxID=173860 RepID=UPI0015C2F907|nr:spermidine/putrescine ABC transporter substrate-binding protein [Streptomyces rectiverticillatus]QLE74223.1 spermidine/putrescine ABC transporter substrate-binding protein [Streptomyces rectiverticillatus]
MERYQPRTTVNRRTLLRAGGAGALACGALASLAGCGIPPAGRPEGALGASEDRSAHERTLAFSNWTEYIDTGPDGTSRPTLDDFKRSTGVAVKYTEDINDNVEFFGKAGKQLAAGQDIGRDLICVTDWMAGRMIRLGWARRLDTAHLPNAYANLAPGFRAPDWDPGRVHSYPWTGIPAVIAYNRRATGGRKVDSVSQLLDDPRLKGRVGLLSEMRDTVGLTLLDMGRRPEEVTAEEYDAAVARLRRARDRGQIRRFTGNDYTGDLNKGDIAACIAWAGDLVQLQAGNSDIRYAIPDAGYMLSSDNLLVPRTARHQRNAERLIDYYYQPKVAARLAAAINYVSPVAGLRDELAKIDKKLAENSLIIPSEAMLAKAHAFRSLTAAEEKAFEAAFSELTGA